MSIRPRTDLAVSIGTVVCLFVVLRIVLEGDRSIGWLLGVAGGGALVWFVAASETGPLPRRPTMISAVALSVVLVALALWLHW